MDVYEQQLIARLLQRDRKAVREFYLKYSPRLFHFIRARVETEQDTEEISQDTLFAFLEGVRDFTQRCSLSSYLYAIANKKIIDFYRKKKIKRIVFSQLPQNLEPVISELLDPQKTFEYTLLAQKIAQIFAQLKPRQALILRLKYIEDKSVAEIAQIFACSFKSAESLLFRARRAFIKLYSVD